MKHSKIYIFLILTISILGCQENGTLLENHQEEDIALSHTIWTEKTELFVEFKPLIVGENSRFAAHFSEMNHFKAILEGEVTVSLISSNAGIRHTVDAPSSPGIFKPSLTPKKAGIYTLVFEITTPYLKDKIIIKDVEVYTSVEEAKKKIQPEEENSNKISFLKEQAWKMEFANSPVVKSKAYEVIKTGGKILPSQGDEKMITATTSGIVIYNSTASVIGSEVKQGQTLFTITGGNLTNNNIETEYIQAKSNYNREKSNFDRKKQLYDSKAIAKSEYEDALLKYQLAESKYLNLSANFNGKGRKIKTSLSGYIKTLFKSECEYVEAGEPLAKITQNKRLTLYADINQSDYHLLNNSITATFLLNGQTHALEEYN
jgi:biotin carboxyl carrier protein